MSDKLMVLNAIKNSDTRDALCAQFNDCFGRLRLELQDAENRTEGEEASQLASDFVQLMTADLISPGERARGADAPVLYALGYWIPPKGMNNPPYLIEALEALHEQGRLAGVLEELNGQGSKPLLAYLVDDVKNLAIVTPLVKFLERNPQYTALTAAIDGKPIQFAPGNDRVSEFHEVVRFMKSVDEQLGLVGPLREISLLMGVQQSPNPQLTTPKANEVVQAMGREASRMSERMPDDIARTRFSVYLRATTDIISKALKHTASNQKTAKLEL